MSKLLNKGLIILGIAILGLIIPMGAYAQDIEISCENNGKLVVSPDPVVSLFDITGIAPGESVSGQIQITNNDADNVCDLSFEVSDVTTDENVISEMMLTEILVDGVNEYGGGGTTLNDLFAEDLFLLASVEPGDVSTIDWSVTFDPSAGNDYQGGSLVFDFLLSFQWGSEADGVEGGAVLGTSTSAGRTGDVLGETGGAILIPFAIGIIGLLSIILYKRFKKHNN